MNAGTEFSNLANQLECMNIAGYISKLLYYNDCVIVPGFGGFITDYAPAKINPTSHGFSPPSKSILFNSKLTNDDGILMHFIAQEEHIPYAEAKMEISYFVEELILELEEGKEIIIEKIGSFSKSMDDSFFFNPDKSVNYLETSFGLSAFISPPITRKPIHKRLEKKFVDRKPVPDSERKDKKVYWTYATIIPVILIVGWFIFMNGYDNKNAQQTGLITMAETDTEIPTEIDHSNEGIDNTTQPLKNLDFSDVEQPSGREEISQAEEALIPNNNVSNLPKYYIIGGAFQFKQNADKLVRELRQSGYNANHEGINPKGLHLVSYYSSEDKLEALANLALIRRDSNPSAWLLKK